MDAISILNQTPPEQIFRTINNIVNPEERYTTHWMRAGGTVDTSSSVIKGVSVITAGVEAKGHNTRIDHQTLYTVLAAAQKFSDGVKVKIDHTSGFDGIVGALKNFHVFDTKLLADLHLLKSHPARERILEMCATIPETFGLSISFSGAPEVIGDRTYARCIELYSVDLVDNPAANPGGLFSAKPMTLTTTEPEDISKARKLFAAMSAMEPKQKTIFYRQHKATLEEAHNLIAAHDAKPKQQFSATQLADLAVIEEYESITDTASKVEFYRANRQAVDRYFREHSEKAVKYGKPAATGIKILDEHNAITDPAERVTHYKSNQRAIDLAFENLSRKQNQL